MPTPLIPQEIFLLERYYSLDYFGEMRDAWAKMVNAAEKSLEQFMRGLPSDYRARHLSEQPDIVWGERVLPNFRSTLESLNAGYILLSRGDLSALAFGGNVQSAIKGQTSDFTAAWMPKELEDQFWHWQGEAGTRALNMSITEHAGWKIGSLSSRYSEQARGPLNAPSSWPQYRINPAVTVETGQPVVRNGIYLPACTDSCAALLIKDYEAWRATVGYDSQTMQNTARTSTTWTLVERLSDTGGATAIGTLRGTDADRRLNCAGGETCPQAGWWFTPAKRASRRFFKLGDLMPVIEGSEYGATYWQWDVNQSAPKL